MARRPGPSFTAMVFWGLRQGPWTRADARKQQGLKLVSRQFRKQRLAVWAAGRGPERPATGSLDPSWRQEKARFEAIVSRQFRKQRLAVWAAGRGPDPSFMPWCLRPATGSLDPSWRQETARFEAIVSRQFRKQRLAVWAAGRGPNPSFTATTGSLASSWRQETAKFEASF